MVVCDSVLGKVLRNAEEFALVRGQKENSESRDFLGIYRIVDFS